MAVTANCAEQPHLEMTAGSIGCSASMRVAVTASACSSGTIAQILMFLSCDADASSSRPVVADNI